MSRGATVAKLVGFNTPRHEIFKTEVFMWVFEEVMDGRKLSEIINQEHENVKYLPGVKLPTNVVIISCIRLSNHGWYYVA